MRDNGTKVLLELRTGIEMKSALIFFGEDGNKNFIFSLCSIIDEYLDKS